jgi:hypothetical protein
MLGLLRQAGGFEGVCPVCEAVHSDDETVPEGEEGRELLLDLDAIPPLKAPAINGENPVAPNLNPLLRLRPSPRPTRR